LLVGQDRGQVIVSEAAGQRRSAESLIDRGGAVEFGEGDGLGHLRPHPGGAGCGGLDEPRRGAVPDGQERGLGRIAGVWGPLTGDRPA
jgi:hypothetical protein